MIQDGLFPLSEVAGRHKEHLPVVRCRWCKEELRSEEARAARHGSSCALKELARQERRRVRRRERQARRAAEAAQAAAGA